MTISYLCERSIPYATPIQRAGDLFPLLKRFAKPQEHFIVITLNGANVPISILPITIGTANRTIAHPREVFRKAISDSACAIIVAHNHPSGKLDPSDDDKALTKRLVQAGDLLGIPVLDHLVFSKTSFLSFVETNLLPCC